MSENPISFKSLTAIQEQHRSLLRERRDHPDNEAFLARAEQFIRATADAGKIFGDSVDRSALQTVLDYWVSVLYRAEIDVEDLVLSEFDLSVQPELSDEDYPYIGLDGFTAQNSDQFHGRNHVLEQLISRLQQNQVLVIVGEPGTGASSLIAAGLIPLIESGALSKDTSFRVLPVVSPGADSFDSLQSEIEGEHENALFLVIDPFDESFRTKSSREDRKKFIRGLKKFVSQPDASNSNRLVLVSTIAARDSIIDGTYEATEWCRDKFSNNSYRIPPMTFSDLRSVVIEPARQVGLHFDEGVVEDLINDVFGEPAALPLLQFSLKRLWHFRDRNRISRQAYEQCKGGRRALGLAAEELWNTLSTDGQEQYKYILTSLASLESMVPAAGKQSSETVGSAWRSVVQTKRLSRDVLRSDATDAKSFDLVINRLIQQGLLRKIEIRSAGTYDVKIAHDALFHWQRFSHWIDESREQLSYQKQLEDMARGFRERGQRLNAKTLAHAQFCRDQVGAEHLSPEVTDLIQASEYRLKMTHIVRAFVGVLLVSLVVYLVWKNHVIEQRYELVMAGTSAISANSKNVTNIVTDAKTVMERVELNAKALTADSEYIVNTVKEARSAMGRESYREVQRFLIPIENKSQDIYKNANAIERRLRNSQGLMEIAKINSQSLTKDINTLEQNYGDKIGSTPIAPFATSSSDRALSITTTFRQENDVQLWGAASKPGAKELAFGGSDGTVLIHNTENYTNDSIRAIDPQGDPSNATSRAIVNDVAFDGKSPYMATGGVDGKVSIWDMGNRSENPLWKCEVPDRDVARVYSIKLGYLADEKLIAAAGLDIDKAAVWDVREQCQKGNPKEPSLLDASGDVFTVDLHPDKQWLVLGSAGQKISVWSLKGGCDNQSTDKSPCEMSTFSDNQGAVISVHFDPSSCTSNSELPCRLLSSTAGGVLSIRELDSAGSTIEGNTQTLMKDTGRQLGMARFSPDGNWVAVASQAGSVSIWSTSQTGEEPPPDFTAENLGGPVFGIAFEDSCTKESCDFRLFAGTFSGRIIKMELPADSSGE